MLLCALAGMLGHMGHIGGRGAFDLDVQRIRWSLFLSRGPHDPQARAHTIEQIFRGLWEHGATFDTTGWEQVTTWEQALAAPAHADILRGGPDDVRSETESLHVCIERMAAARDSNISIYGAEVSMYLGFNFAIDPEASAEEAALLADPIQRADVNVYCDRMQLQSSSPMSSDVFHRAKRVSPDPLDTDIARMYPRVYLGQYEEFWRWCIVLCELTSPVFGLGYTDDLLTWHGFDEHTAYYNSGGQELVERRLPSLDGLFTRPPARYLAADFPAELKQQAVEEATHASAVVAVIQPLKTGGTLVRPGHPIFTPESERAFTVLRQAELIIRRLDAIVPQLDARATDDDIRRAVQQVNDAQREKGRQLALVARDLLQRARRVFLVVGEETQAAYAEQSLQRVTWAEQCLGIRPID